MGTIIARACIVANLAMTAGLIVVVQARLAREGHGRRGEDSDEEHRDDSGELHVGQSACWSKYGVIDLQAVDGDVSVLRSNCRSASEQTSSLLYLSIVGIGASYISVRSSAPGRTGRDRQPQKGRAAGALL